MPLPTIIWAVVTFGLRSLSRKAFADPAWKTRPKLATSIARATRCLFTNPPKSLEYRARLRGAQSRLVWSSGLLIHANDAAQHVRTRYRPMVNGSNGSAAAQGSGTSFGHDCGTTATNCRIFWEY